MNTEQFEAVQQDKNSFRESFIDSLPAQDQDKFKIVEQASKMLVDAGINFYLFPDLPCPENPKKNVVWQWNSIFALAEKDEFGNVTPESEESQQRVQTLALYSIYKNFAYGPAYDNLSAQEKLNRFFDHLIYAIKFTCDYLDN